MSPLRTCSIERHFIEQQQLHPEATGELTRLMHQLAFAAKQITKEVRSAGLSDILGVAGHTNVQGEVVQKLDEITNDVIYRAMDHAGVLCCMASEERADMIPIPAEFEYGKYTLAFDPLDGSSNIDANINVGTIFAIHRRSSPDGTPGTVEDLLQPGRELVVAGYIVYGSSTMMVYTTGHGVNGFTLEPSIGEFLLSHPDMRIPQHGKYFSINMGNYHYWSEGVRKYIDHIIAPNNQHGTPYSSRYIGSMIADVHRTLLYGGLFMYPLDYKDPQKPKSKLRLLYEASPMSMVIEQAGGASSDGSQSILDVIPRGLHDRVQLFVGSRDNLAELLSFLEKYDG
ncbi:MAG: class 1 fructose-bisphosphatase [bacterium]|nr:class 1 fructose-bisphosphatase [bacterium]MBK8128435.1 class 1 fructose-bisphosphatase [bacterium]